MVRCDQVLGSVLRRLLAISAYRNGGLLPNDDFFSNVIFSDMDDNDNTNTAPYAILSFLIEIMYAKVYVSTF
jgi:hypothetical protein